jgi:hypothetical protein
MRKSASPAPGIVANLNTNPAIKTSIVNAMITIMRKKTYPPSAS